MITPPNSNPLHTPPKSPHEVDNADSNQTKASSNPAISSKINQLLSSTKPLVQKFSKITSPMSQSLRVFRSYFSGIPTMEKKDVKKFTEAYKNATPQQKKELYKDLRDNLPAYIKNLGECIGQCENETIQEILETLQIATLEHFEGYHSDGTIETVNFLTKESYTINLAEKIVQLMKNEKESTETRNEVDIRLRDFSRQTVIVGNRLFKPEREERKKEHFDALEKSCNDYSSHEEGELLTYLAATPFGLGINEFLTPRLTFCQPYSLLTFKVTDDPPMTASIRKEGENYIVTRRDCYKLEYGGENSKLFDPLVKGKFIYAEKTATIPIAVANEILQRTNSNKLTEHDIVRLSQNIAVKVDISGLITKEEATDRYTGIITKNISRMKQEDIQKIPPESFALMQPNQLEKFSAKQFKMLSKEQLGHIPPSNFPYISIEKMKGLSATQFGSFTVEQQLALCKEHIAALCPDQIKELKPDFFAKARLWQLKQLTPQQIPELTDKQIREIPQENLIRLPATLIAAFVERMKSNDEFSEKVTYISVNLPAKSLSEPVKAPDIKAINNNYSRLIKPDEIIQSNDSPDTEIVQDVEKTLNDLVEKSAELGYKKVILEQTIEETINSDRKNNLHARYREICELKQIIEIKINDIAQKKGISLHPEVEYDPRQNLEATPKIIENEIKKVVNNFDGLGDVRKLLTTEKQNESVEIQIDGKVESVKVPEELIRDLERENIILNGSSLNGNKTSKLSALYKNLTSKQFNVVSQLAYQAILGGFCTELFKGKLDEYGRSISSGIGAGAVGNISKNLIMENQLSDENKSKRLRLHFSIKHEKDGGLTIVVKQKLQLTNRLDLGINDPNNQLFFETKLVIKFTKEELEKDLNVMNPEVTLSTSPLISDFRNISKLFTLDERISDCVLVRKLMKGVHAFTYLKEKSTTRFKQLKTSLPQLDGRTIFERYLASSKTDFTLTYEQKLNALKLLKQIENLENEKVENTNDIKRVIIEFEEIVHQLETNDNLENRRFIVSSAIPLLKQSLINASKHDSASVNKLKIIKTTLDIISERENDNIERAKDIMSNLAISNDRGIWENTEEVLDRMFILAESGVDLSSFPEACKPLAYCRNPQKNKDQIYVRVENTNLKLTREEYIKHIQNQHSEKSKSAR